MASERSQTEFKLLLESLTLLRGDKLKGRVEISYFEGMTRHAWTLRVKNKMILKNSNSRPVTKTLVKRDQKKRWSQSGEHVKLNKVMPSMRPSSKQESHNEGYSYFKELVKSKKKKLNRIENVGKDTNHEEDRLVLQLSARPASYKDLFSHVLFEKDLELSEKLSNVLAIKANDPVSLSFEIDTKKKLICSGERKINLIDKFDLDSRREHFVQLLVYKRASTLGLYNGPQTDLDSNEGHERGYFQGAEEFQVSSFLELLKDGKVVCSQEITVLEPHTVGLDSVSMNQTGTYTYRKKFFMCLSKKCHSNYALTLNDNRLSQSKTYLTISFRAQYSILKHFKYIDFKLNEKISKSGEVFSYNTIQATCYQIQGKNHSVNRSDPSDYFEIILRADFKELEISSFFSIESHLTSVSHNLLVYLSNWPLTFCHPLANFDVWILKAASADHSMDLLPDTSNLFSFEEVDALNLSL